MIRRRWTAALAFWLAASAVRAADFQAPIPPEALSPLSEAAAQASDAFAAPPGLPAAEAIAAPPAQERAADAAALPPAAAFAPAGVPVPAWKGLGRLSGRLAARPGQADGALGGAFDGRGPSSNAPASPLPAPVLPTLPQGVASVTIHDVHTAEDVRAAIPLGYQQDVNRELVERLMNTVEQMAPYRVYDYRDRQGGHFIAIDLSGNPGLADLLPEQGSHEIRTIKKIQLWNVDLQVVLRETGKTPDLIVGGTVTELKSSSGLATLSLLLNKANSQVYEHARRHGLGPGAVIIDLNDASLPPERILAEIEDWRRLPEGTNIPGSPRQAWQPKVPVALARIYVFQGPFLLEFVRQASGAYAPVPAAMPVAALAAARPSVRRARGGQGGDTAIAEAFRRAEMERRLRRIIERKHYRFALRVWGNFARTAPAETVRAVGQRVGDLLVEAGLRVSRRRGR